MSSVDPGIVTENRPQRKGNRASFAAITGRAVRPAGRRPDRAGAVLGVHIRRFFSYFIWYKSGEVEMMRLLEGGEKS